MESCFRVPLGVMRVIPAQTHDPPLSRGGVLLVLSVKGVVDSLMRVIFSWKNVFFCVVGWVLGVGSDEINGWVNPLLNPEMDLSSYKWL